MCCSSGPRTCSSRWKRWVLLWKALYTLMHDWCQRSAGDWQKGLGGSAGPGAASVLAGGFLHRQRCALPPAALPQHTGRAAVERDGVDRRWDPTVQRPPAPQVSASLAAVREAKQAAETQMALARIEAEAKARAAEEMKKASQGPWRCAVRPDLASSQLVATRV